MKENLIYEGKAKKIYSTDSPVVFLQEFKDDATAFNGLKKDKIPHKGELNNQISSKIFEFLKENDIGFDDYVKAVTSSDKSKFEPRIQKIARDIYHRFRRF